MFKDNADWFKPADVTTEGRAAVLHRLCVADAYRGGTYRCSEGCDRDV